MKNFVIISDLHLRIEDPLGVNLGGLNSRLTDRLNNCKVAVDYAIENKCDGLFILGDIFNKINPNEKLRKLFIRNVIKPCIENKIKIIILMGNHDTNYDVVSFETEAELANCLIQDSIIFIVEPTEIELVEGLTTLWVPYGFPVGTTPYRIGFGHHGIAGAETGVGVIQRSGEECSLKDFENIDLFFTGHYHKAQTLTNANGSQVIYVSSIARWDFGERLDAKRFIHLSVDAQLDIKWDSIPINDRTFIQLEYHDNEDYMSIPLDITDAVVKLLFRGTREWVKTLNRQEIKKHYMNKNAHNVFVDVDFTDDKRLLAVDIKKEDTDEDIIKKFSKEKKLTDEEINFGLTLFKEI